MSLQRNSSAHSGQIAAGPTLASVAPEAAKSDESPLASSHAVATVEDFEVAQAARMLVEWSQQ